ncbi:hypothetical protein AYL99_02409 [Fonsecaea erecta]|uniref:DUF1275 domain protein n=1 Tax=Fonsecaea erecta TaxID=1367422 RepID=A0A178ZTU3_9EURO|nr:hypothetical protein AYL99_02409 [Fonsecaea erecta]OAP63182.1 hypothetical protein AYL99_02409 [Fonsecaea erecta]
MGFQERSRRTVDACYRHLVEDLDPSYMSLVLVICFFISGLIDSVAFNTWSCFVNMQTGNTVFAALGLGGQPKASHKQQYYKSLTSIGAFCLGALFFSALHRYPQGPGQQRRSRTRVSLIVSFFVQTVLVVVAASLVSTNEVSNQPFVAGTFSSGNDEIPPSTINFLDLCPIALISFQAAGQVTLSRLLSVVELPTIVLSALYHDVCADLYTIRDSWRKSSSLWEFFAVSERKQQRRAACIVALFLGGVIGGEMYKSSAGMAGALWLAAGLKFGILFGWFFWKAQKGDDDCDDQLP